MKPSDKTAGRGWAWKTAKPSHFGFCSVFEFEAADLPCLCWVSSRNLCPHHNVFKHFMGINAFQTSNLVTVRVYGVHENAIVLINTSFQLLLSLMSGSTVAPLSEQQTFFALDLCPLTYSLSKKTNIYPEIHFCSNICSSEIETGHRLSVMRLTITVVYNDVEIFPLA